jgi:predicted MFS family arabinose efflux permease
MIALVYGLTRASTDGWGNPVAVTALAGAVALLAAFLVVQVRVRQPIAPLRLFADRARTTALLTMLLFPAAMFGMFFFLTQFLQQTHGYGALRTGFAFLPMTILLLASSALAARLLPRAGVPRLAAAGGVVVTAGVVWLAQISRDSGCAEGILGPVLLFGAGAGLVFAPLTMSILSRVEPAESGAATGLLNTMQQVGGALGLAVLVTVATSASAPIDGMSRAFWVASAFTATRRAGVGQPAPDSEGVTGRAPVLRARPARRRPRTGRVPSGWWCNGAHDPRPATSVVQRRKVSGAGPRQCGWITTCGHRVARGHG